MSENVSSEREFYEHQKRFARKRKLSYNETPASGNGIRSSYKKSEDTAMATFLYNTGQQAKCRGNLVYSEMATLPELKHRTPQSLRTRFYRYVLRRPNYIESLCGKEIANTFDCVRKISGPALERAKKRHDYGRNRLLGRWIKARAHLEIDNTPVRHIEKLKLKDPVIEPNDTVEPSKERVANWLCSLPLENMRQQNLLPEGDCNDSTSEMESRNLNISLVGENDEIPSENNLSLKNEEVLCLAEFIYDTFMDSDQTNENKTIAFKTIKIVQDLQMLADSLISL